MGTVNSRPAASFLESLIPLGVRQRLGFPLERCALALALLAASLLLGLHVIEGVASNSHLAAHPVFLWLAASLASFLAARTPGESFGFHVSVLGMGRYLAGWNVVASTCFLAVSPGLLEYRPLATVAAILGLGFALWRMGGGFLALGGLMAWAGFLQWYVVEDVNPFLVGAVTLLSFLPLLFAVSTCLLVSLACHEWGHARMALALGDDTALRAGRVSLDPSPHFSLAGMIGFPLALLFLGSPMVFGWARPVPLRMDRLRSPRYGSAAVMAAGPAVNFLLAAAGALAMAILEPEQGTYLHMLGWGFVAVNVGLGAINLLPLPPLDGGRIALALAPISDRRFLYAVAKDHWFILGALVLLLGVPWVLDAAFGVAFNPFEPMMEIAEGFLGLVTNGEHETMFDWARENWIDWVDAVVATNDIEIGHHDIEE